jgi:hypothetical protein
VNFLITEEGDEFKYQLNDETIVPLEIGACGNYGDRPSQLVDILNKLIKDQYQTLDNMFFVLNRNGVLRFTVVTALSEGFSFRLLPMSTRLMMLLGLYNTDPTSLDSKMLDSTHYYIDFPSAPMQCFGNILYLISSNSSIIGVNDESNGEYKLSIAYKYGELMIAACPMVSKKAGYWISCRGDD